MTKKLNELSLIEAITGLKEKKFTAVELTKACLAKIQDRERDLNAFVTVRGDEALHEAAVADKEIAAGTAGDLAGVPFSVKDAIVTATVRSTASAKILDNYIPPFEATVIKKLRDQGAILIGKNNCDAFGHGASNENSMYGSVRNPHDLSKVAGGSSGGSAAAVADNMCIFSIGEDTGGSIRQPASFCGVVGLRPSYGRNSRFGIMPMASSLDTVGPITKTVADAAVLEKIMAGKDEKDATTVPDEVPDYLSELSNGKKITVGIPQEYYSLPGMDSEVKEIVLSTVEKLKSAGCKIKEVSLPHTKYATAVYYILVPSEDSSNMARLDSIRYGVQAEADNLYDLYNFSRAQGFPEEVKRRIFIGTYALSAGYYDAYYKKAQKVRTLIINDFAEAFKNVDVLITPTSPFPAFNVGEKTADPLTMYLADVMLSPSSVAGVPAISVPAGFTKAGLPVGVQIIGARLQEGKVFNIANQIFNQK